MKQQPMVVRIAQGGALDENGHLWPGRVLRKAAPLFEGKPVYPSHPSNRIGIDHWGYLRDVQYLGTDETGYLCGLIQPHDGRIARHLREAAAAGKPLGVSMHVGDATLYRPKGRDDVRVVIDIKSIRSVDLVERPAIPGSRVLTEADGFPIRPDDDRVPLMLLEGRQEAPVSRRDPLAVLEEKLTRLVEAGNRKAGARPRLERIVESAVSTWSDQVADGVVEAFKQRYGPGPWRIRSVA